MRAQQQHIRTTFLLPHSHPPPQNLTARETPARPCLRREQLVFVRQQSSNRPPTYALESHALLARACCSPFLPSVPRRSLHFFPPFPTNPSPPFFLHYRFLHSSRARISLTGRTVGSRSLRFSTERLACPPFEQSRKPSQQGMTRTRRSPSRFFFLDSKVSKIPDVLKRERKRTERNVFLPITARSDCLFGLRAFESCCQIPAAARAQAPLVAASLPASSQRHNHS